MREYLDTETVRAHLTPPAITNWYSWPVRRLGAWLRSRICPACGSGESEALAIGEHGFKCHRCDAHGDLFTLIGLFEGASPKQDFRRILNVAGAIAGIVDGVPPSVGIGQRADAVESTRASLKRKEVARCEWAAIEATRTWDALSTSSDEGGQYLRQRGLVALIGHDDVVRFDGLGTVRVPLFDWEGRIINVPGRYLPGVHPDGRRILNMKGCPTRGSFGQIDLLNSRDGPVVLCEGIFDYLSALILWPDRCVLGAHGAGNLSHVAQRVAIELANTKTTLFIIPHNDKTGQNAARKARQLAVKAGMRADCIRFYDVTEAGDLNDWLLTSA